ncbi:hypothetical protein ABBQ32_002410 [Trebouxia sp. C0010 RCD-2024]
MTRSQLATLRVCGRALSGPRAAWNAHSKGRRPMLTCVIGVSPLSRNMMEFLIKWEGFDSTHDSWEPEACTHDPEIVQD